MAMSCPREGWWLTMACACAGEMSTTKESAWNQGSRARERSACRASVSFTPLLFLPLPPNWCRYESCGGTRPLGKLYVVFMSAFLQMSSSGVCQFRRVPQVPFHLCAML